MTRPFRFGVNILTVGDRAEWVAKSRRAEELGYDVILVPDHLDRPAPLPSLSLTAEHTSRARLGTLVLNTGFWNPVLLARDVQTLNTYSRGRLELGLGAGYVRWEFEEAGLAWPSIGDRLARLTSTVRAIRAADESVPILIGGNGNRVLRHAAEHADIVSFAGMKVVQELTPPLAFITADELDDRVAFAREAAGDRDYESNLLIQNVIITDDRRSGVDRIRSRYTVDVSTDVLLDVPALLTGTPEEIVAQVQVLRDRFGITYITVLDSSMESFGRIIPMVRAASSAE